MQVPKINFRATDGFDTIVQVGGEEADYLINEHEIAVDDLVVLVDELEIEYVGEIKAVGETTVEVAILRLLADVQGGGGARGGLKAQLDALKRARREGRR